MRAIDAVDSPFSARQEGETPTRERELREQLQLRKESVDQRVEAAVVDVVLYSQRRARKTPFRHTFDQPQGDWRIALASSLQPSSPSSFTSIHTHARDYGSEKSPAETDRHQTRPVWRERKQREM